MPRAARPKPAGLSLEVRRVIAAPRERVFRAWTSPHEFQRWHAPGAMTVPVAEVDLRVGGRYRITMRGPDGDEHRVTGTYRIVEPPARLVYTWQWETGHDATESLVTVEFLDRGDSTELVLRHERFANERQRASHEQGWTSILERLAATYHPAS
jgi:uncharacterized protein YndB with AHSA1/START domain